MLPQRFIKNSDRFELKLADYSADKSEILIPVWRPNVGDSAKQPKTETVFCYSVWLVVLLEVAF